MRVNYGNAVVLGYVFVMCDEDKSRQIKRKKVIGIDSIFNETSYLTRKEIFLRRLIQEKNGIKLYDSAALLFVKKNNEFTHPPYPEISLLNFVDSIIDIMRNKGYVD